LAISIASVDDILAWCVLAIASSFVRSNDALFGFYTFLLALAYVLIMVVIVRPFLRLAYQKFYNPGSNDSDNRSFIVCVFLYLVISAFTCETMGIHAFFGSFFAGVIFPRKYELIPAPGEELKGPAKLKFYFIPCGYASAHIHPDMPDFIEHVGPKIELIIVDFFLPMYFTLSGIKTNIGSLNSGELWGDCIAVILIACGAKFVPAMLATKFCAPPDPETGKRHWKFAMTMGFIMNTRGLVELIALNIAHDSGILSDRLFTMLVLMAIITTMMTTPMMHLLYLNNQPKSPGGRPRVNSDRAMLTPVHGHERAASSMFPPGLALGPAHTGVAMSTSTHNTPRAQSQIFPKTPLHANPAAEAAIVSTNVNGNGDHNAPAKDSSSNGHANVNGNGDNTNGLPRFHYDVTLPASDAPPSLPSSSAIELSAITVTPSSQPPAAVAAPAQVSAPVPLPVATTNVV
jgi:Kef-type K+ transport system membrane component KefB